jgi:hypothetical protein
MVGATRAEIYFIVAMMFLILIVCGVSMYFFFATYKREMREKQEREAKKLAEKKNSEA